MTTNNNFEEADNYQIDYGQVKCLEKRARVERSKSFLSFLKKLYSQPSINPNKEVNRLHR